MKTLDEILADIGIEPNKGFKDNYESNYTNVKKMFVEWANELIGEDEKVGEPHMEYFEIGGQYVSYRDEITRNKLRAEQRACIEKEGNL